MSEHVRGRMKKRAAMSECKDPENRSDKDCACGGHQGKRGKKKRKRRVRPKHDA